MHSHVTCSFVCKTLRKSILRCACLNLCIKLIQNILIGKLISVRYEVVVKWKCFMQMCSSTRSTWFSLKWCRISYALIAFEKIFYHTYWLKLAYYIIFIIHYIFYYNVMERKNNSLLFRIYNYNEHLHYSYLVVQHTLHYI